MNDSTENYFTGNYFVDGGTLRPDTPSYVKRPADDELFRALLAGEYCYVLTPRQMGKSSLMIHTSQKLKEHNVKTAIVDIQRIGTNKVKEWYGSMLSQVRRGLGLKVDPNDWLEQRSNLGYGELFVQFVQDIVLAEIPNPVVIFFDEVDWMIKLDFRDDFFASIRAIYNARAQFPELSRISFVLLGVAAPADLIAEPTRTPFNIGHAIPLQELSFDDADPLLEGIQAIYPEDGQRILERIFHWTSGHPYLTQKVCKAIVEGPKLEWSNDRVDDLVTKLFLSEESRKEANIKFIQDRILGNEQRGELLKFYKRSLRSRVKENGQSVVQNQLMLSGLLTTEDGYVKVRNRIYRTVFDERWIDHHMPKDWQRVVNVVLGVVLGVLIITFTTIFFSDRSKEINRLPRYRGDFFAAYNNRSTRDEVASLANIIRTEGILKDLGGDSTARNLFFDELKTRDDQLRLFTDYKELGAADGVSLSDNQELQEDLVIVIKGVYSSLAMVDPTRDNTELLQAMWDCLGKIQGETASALREEIGHWRDARIFIANARAWKVDDNPLNDTEIPGQYDSAQASYAKAIDVNPANPALYFERAQLYINLRDPSGKDDETIGKNALKDLNAAIGILQFRTSRDVPPIPSATRIVASPTATATSMNETVTSPSASANTDSAVGTATPLAARPPTRRPEVIIMTQTPVTSTPTNLPKTISRTATPTPPESIEFATITPTSLPEPFERGFYRNNRGEYPDILSVVQNVLRNNPWLGDILMADPNSYPNLQLVGFATLYPTLTPSPIPSPTTTPTLIVPVLANLEKITEENASRVDLLGQLGRGSIRSVVYSPDGKIFAVGSSLGIYFYDSASLDLLGSIATIDGVSSLAFSPNGQVLASSLDSLGIYFWDVNSRLQVGRVLVGHSGEIRDLAFSPDGAMLASASADNTVYLWRRRDGVLIEKIEHPGVVRSVAFNPSGELLASGSAAPKDDNPDAGKVWLWNVPNVDTIISKPPVSVREFETIGSSTVAFSPDGQILAAGSDDDSIRLWRVNDGRFITFSPGGGKDIAFSPDGKTLAAVSLQNYVISLRKTENNSLESIASLAGHTDLVLNAMFSSDSKTILSTSVDNTVRLWDTSSGKQRLELDDHVISPYVAIAPSGKLIASGAEDGSVYLWQLGEAKIIEILKGHTGAVRTLAFNSSGTLLASGSDDGTVRVWNVADGSLRSILSGHTSNVFSVVFWPGQNYLISGSADGTIRVWDAQSGTLAMPPLIGSAPTQYTIYSLAFHPQVFPIAVGLGEPQIGVYYFGSEGPNSIRVIPAAGTIAIDPLRGHTKAVRSLAFSPDGEVLASGSDDSTVRLWHVESSGGSQLTVLNGHTDTVRSVAFSPDSRILASASYDRTIRLWSVNSESVLQVLTGHRAEIYSMAFSLDGKFIVSGSPDGTICIWGISP